MILVTSTDPKAKQPKVHATRIISTDTGATTVCGKHLDEFNVTSGGLDDITCGSCIGKLDPERTQVYGGDAA